jgi:hypothetical protein
MFAESLEKRSELSGVGLNHPVRHVADHGPTYPRAMSGDGREFVPDISSLGIIVVQHFEQCDRPADYHSKRTTNKPKTRKPFPSRRLIQRLTVMPVELAGENGAVADSPGTKKPRVLSLGQFQALYDAIASSSGWWPLADSRWDWPTYFCRLEKYVMYLDELPVGFGALDRSSDGLNVTRIVFVGIVPAMQGYRFGIYLFNFINHLAREGGTETIVLNTAPEFDRMKGTGKPEQSAVKMYLNAGFRLVRTDIVDARRAAANAHKLESLNLPAYYKNNPLFTREHLIQKLCDEFHCRKPHLPDKTKSR